VRNRCPGCHPGTLVAGNCPGQLACWAWQVVVKVYGVATMMPQEQSRVPNLSTEQ